MIKTKFNGYSVHSNDILPTNFSKLVPKNLVSVLKPHIKQVYFKIKIPKEWGLSGTQLYEMVLRQELIAYGYYMPQKSTKYIFLSYIGKLPAASYYFVYKPLPKFVKCFLIFPFHMKLHITIRSCKNCNTKNVCEFPNGYKQCFHCDDVTHISILPSFFKYGDLILSAKEASMYVYTPNKIIEFDKDKYCRLCMLNRPHTQCNKIRFKKNLKLLRKHLQCE